MSKSYLMLDLKDPRLAAVADVVNNKTAKNILNLLAEKELSESEIAMALNIPMNTVGYNIKKLISAGLIHQSKDFLWSIRGKKILRYKLSNRKIIISPVAVQRGIIPAVLLTFAGAGVLKFMSNLAIKNYEMSQTTTSFAKVASTATDVAGSSAGQIFNNPFYTFLAGAPNAWAWFLVGALTAILVFLIWNWRRE